MEFHHQRRQDAVQRRPDKADPDVDRLFGGPLRDLSGQAGLRQCAAGLVQEGPPRMSQLDAAP